MNKNSSLILALNILIRLYLTDDDYLQVLLGKRYHIPYLVSHITNLWKIQYGYKRLLLLSTITDTHTCTYIQTDRYVDIPSGWLQVPLLS